MTRPVLLGAAAALVIGAGLALAVAADRPASTSPAARDPSVGIRIAVVPRPQSAPIAGPKLETVPPGVEDAPLQTLPPAQAAPSAEFVEDPLIPRRAEDDWRSEPSAGPYETYAEADEAEPRFRDDRRRWREDQEETGGEYPLYRDDHDGFVYPYEAEPPPPSARWSGR